MADLSTLDQTQPDNTDLARFGAQEIRATREALLTSFAIEHYLTGEHKFLSGNTASRPAAAKAGRIYINIQTSQLEYDTGSAWLPVPRGNTIASHAEVNDIAATSVGLTETVIGQNSIDIQVGGYTEIDFSTGGDVGDSAFGAATFSLIIRIRKDGTSLVADGSIVASTSGSQFLGVPTHVIKVPWSGSLKYAEVPSVGSHLYKLTAQGTTTNGLYIPAYIKRYQFGRIVEHA